MATNHTTNYNLNLWTPTDKFVREEFNENTTKLDAAIKAVDAKADTKAAASTVTALAQTVNTKASTAAVNTLAQTVAQKADAAQTTVALGQKAEVFIGSYTGITNHEVTSTRQITLGFRPKLVLIWSIYGGWQQSAMAIDGQGMHNGSLTINDTGFIVGTKYQNYPQMDVQNGKYMYFALR